MTHYKDAVLVCAFVVVVVGHDGVDGMVVVVVVMVVVGVRVEVGVVVEGVGVGQWTRHIFQV